MHELLKAARPDPVTQSALARPHEATRNDAAPNSPAIFEPNPVSQRRLRGCAAIGALVTLLVGGVVLTGWLFDVAALRMLVPGLRPTNANAAFGLVLLAGALLLRLRRPGDRRADAAVTFLCAVAIVLGAATLLEYLGHWDLRIDQLLAPERNPAAGVPDPARMSPTAALNLVLLGSAMLLMDGRSRLGRRSAEGLAMLAAFTSLAALFGYLYGAPDLYQVGDMVAISLPAAAACHVLSLSILAARPDRGLAALVASDGASAALLRRVMPAGLVLPIVGWLRLVGQRQGLYGTEFGLAVMVTSAAVILFAVVWRSAWWLHGIDVERTVLVQELDHRVESRTRELAATVDGLHEAQQRFEHAFTDAPIGMALVGPDGRFVQVNSAFCHLIGYAESDLLDRTFVDITHPDDLAASVDAREQLLAGEIEHYETEKRYVHALGHGVWVQIMVSLVRDTRGRPNHFITQIQDVAERKDREERLGRQAAHAASFVAFATTLRAPGLGAAAVLDNLTTEIVDSLGDTCCVFLVGDDGRTLHEAAWHSREPEAIEIARHLLAPRPYATDSGPFTEVFGTGKLLNPRHVDSEALREDLPTEYRPILDRVGVGSMVYVRLRAAGGAVVGVMVTVRFSSHSPYTDDDVAFLEEIGQHAAYAYESARLHERLQHEEERFRVAFADAPIGMTLVDVDRRFMQVNHAFSRLIGYQESDIVGRSIVDVTHPDDVAADRELIAQLLAGEIPRYQVEKRYLHALGHDVWAQVTASLVRDAEGAPIHFIGQIEGIADRIHAMAVADEANSVLTESIDMLERSHRDVSLINDMTEFLQACVGPEEIRDVVERSLQELLAGGSGTLALVGLSNSHLEPVATWGPPVDAVPSFPPDDCWALRRGRPHVVQAGSTAPRCRHLETPASAAAATGTALCVPLMAQGEALGVLTWQVAEGLSNDECAIHTERGRELAVAVAGHISLAVANLKLRESLRAQSIRDPLTELFNRRYMEESLDRELARATRKKASLGIIAIDIDHFKLFNDAHGHAAGDAVLQAVGRLLESGIRQEDIACRSGGEEFVLILPDASLEITVGRAEHLREEVKRLALTHQEETLAPVTLSFGVAAAPEHGSAAQTLLRAADTALYRSKADGRDRVTVADAPADLVLL